LTVNGKLDRGGLPDPAVREGGDHGEPENATEAALCGIYGEVLGLAVTSVGVEDDFFRLGGNSILAIRLVSRINKVMETDIRVTAIFRYKTIRQLSGHLMDTEEERVRIIAHPVNDPRHQVLSFAQERMFFIDRYEDGSNAYNIPIVFKLQESVYVESFLSAIRSVIRRHEVLRSVIRTSEEGVNYQQVLNESENFVFINRVSVSSQQELQEAIGLAVKYSFQLDRECPIRVSLYSVPEEHIESRYMSIVLHHIAFDGWSMDVLLREVLNYYYYHEALRYGDEEKAGGYELEAMQLQYKDFALWQRTYLSGAVLDRQMKYWREKLSGYEELRLPTDKVRPAQKSYAGAEAYFSLGGELSQELKEVAKELEVSLYSVLLSGYYLLLSSYSGQQDIVIGTPIANRHYREVEDMIGFFVNTLVLRERIDAGQDLDMFIRQVGRSVEEAQLHQDLPFEKLIDELGVEQDASRNPVFQVMFGVQRFGRHQSEEASRLLDVYQGDHGYRIAKFDMTTMLEDRGQEIAGSVNYATSLFEPDTILAYIATYKQILAQIATLKS